MVTLAAANMRLARQVRRHEHGRQRAGNVLRKSNSSYAQLVLHNNLGPTSNMVELSRSLFLSLSGMFYAGCFV